MPPISATWPTVPRKPRRLPSKKNGVTSRCSGMCEPPRYGSLWTITSPGSNSSAPTSSMTQRPEKSACPSIAGFMFAIATAISSQMLTNCEWRIFRKTGSGTSRLQASGNELVLLECVRLDDHQAALRMRAHDLTVEDDRRRVDLLDDQRPTELDVATEVLAPVDRRLDPAELLEVDRPRGDRLRRAELGERERRRRVAVLDRDRGQVDELDDTLGDPVAVGALVRLVEAFDGEPDEVFGLERDADLLLVVLSEVAAADRQRQQRIAHLGFAAELVERLLCHALEAAAELAVDRLVGA